MPELIILLLVALLLVLWIDHRRAQEIVVAHCRQACQALGVQFLDDTAAMRRFGLARDGNGRVRLRRIYTFEYSPSAGERGRGSAILLGRTLTALNIPVEPPPKFS
ncbi:MAG: DUF3301 domain-containing protein [Gammaproteobacteria bacterium]|nr:DUF3301 domain-containing protein [Gammaproteobacteria bacterium]